MSYSSLTFGTPSSLVEEEKTIINGLNAMYELQKKAFSAKVDAEKSRIQALKASANKNLTYKHELVVTDGLFALISSPDHSSLSNEEIEVVDQLRIAVSTSFRYINKVMFTADGSPLSDQHYAFKASREYTNSRFLPKPKTSNTNWSDVYQGVLCYKDLEFLANLTLTDSQGMVLTQKLNPFMVELKRLNSMQH